LLIQKNLCYPSISSVKFKSCRKLGTLLPAALLNLNNSVLGTLHNVWVSGSHFLKQIRSCWLSFSYHMRTIDFWLH